MSRPWSHDFQVGLHVPEQKEGELFEFRTCEQMRKIIFEQSRDSALIANVMMHADRAGFSGEDRYTILAFHALTQLEHHFQRCMELMRLMPMPPTILKADGN